MKMEVEWSKYSSQLPVAEAIYAKLLPEPRTANELADRHNKVGSIIRLILEEHGK